MGTDYIAIKEITDRLTLEEKAKLCSGADSWHTKGIERLGVPSVMMTDGPHGLRKMKSMDLDLEINDSVPATCFPTAAAMASSWDEELNEEYIIPAPFDPRVKDAVARAVAQAARDSGVARI